MRKSVAAAIAASGLAIGGAGVMIAGQGPAAGNGSGNSVQAGTVAGEKSLQKDDSGGAAQSPAVPKVTNAAQAADLVLRKAGGGRVTGVKLDEVGGRAVWKVTYLVGAGQRGAQVDALTQAVRKAAPDPAATGTGGTASNSGVQCDDDDDDGDDDAADDDADDDDDDDDDDDEGDRRGVEPSK